MQKNKKLLVLTVTLLLMAVGLGYYYCSTHVTIHYIPVSKTNYHSTF